LLFCEQNSSAWLVARLSVTFAKSDLISFKLSAAIDDDDTGRGGLISANDDIQHDKLLAK
jgi:hypothetical protein